jgi:hypothetical protein
MKEPLLSELKTHLEFFGYEVTVDEDGDVLARHARHFNSSVTKFQGGVLVMATFGGMEAEESNESDVLREINRFNSESALTLAFLNPSRGIAISAWYPLPYNKVNFSTFIEQFHREQGKFALTKILDLTKSVVEKHAAESAVPAQTEVDTQSQS